MASVITCLCFKVQDPIELNLQRSLTEATEAQGSEIACPLLHSQLRGGTGIIIQIPKYDCLFIMPDTIIPLLILKAVSEIEKFMLSIGLKYFILEHFLHCL